MEENMGIKRIKCIFCGKTTTVHKVKTKKKVNDKVITLINSPVHFCKKCKETFLSKEAQDMFDYIKSNGLEKKAIMFDYDILERDKQKLHKG
jgi:YgiT-type zinc finger domain-containing protein